MAQITFNLTNAAELDCMVAAPAINGGWVAGSLPNGMLGPGMYLIYNHATNNRYVGISSALQTRFQRRYETVTEFGYPANIMRQVIVWWGTVATTDTATQFNPNPPVIQVADYTNHTIDNVAVDPERILIAFVMRHFLAGTMTNNVKVAPYANPGLQSNLTVTLNWGASQTAQNGSHSVTWAPGALF